MLSLPSVQPVQRRARLATPTSIISLEVNTKSAFDVVRTFH